MLHTLPWRTSQPQHLCLHMGSEEADTNGEVLLAEEPQPEKIVPFTLHAQCLLHPTSRHEKREQPLLVTCNNTGS